MLQPMKVGTLMLISKVFESGGLYIGRRSVKGQPVLYTSLPGIEKTIFETTGEILASSEGKGFFVHFCSRGVEKREYIGRLYQNALGYVFAFFVVKTMTIAAKMKYILSGWLSLSWSVAVFLFLYFFTRVLRAKMNVHNHVRRLEVIWIFQKNNT